MSELTLCNRCTYNRIVADHPEATIRLKEVGMWTECWVDTGFHSERVASFLELPEECAC